jgi:hypothetical protein
MRTQADIDRSIAVAEKAIAEGRSPTHQEMYPEQYRNENVGRQIVVEIDGAEKARGKVTRVIDSPYGRLVEINGDSKVFWPLKNCRLTKPST